MKKNKGVTLIALVITIIVLLILAGVALAMIMGDSGIFGKANKASERTRESQALEDVRLLILETKTRKEGNATLGDVFDTIQNSHNKYIVKTTSDIDEVATLDSRGIQEKPVDIDSLEQIYVTNVDFEVEVKITNNLTTTVVGINSVAGGEDSEIATLTSQLNGLIDEMRLINSATAKAEHILPGYTAYKGGQLVTGSYTSNATFSSTSIGTMTSSGFSYKFTTPGYAVGTLGPHYNMSTSYVLVNGAVGSANPWNIQSATNASVYVPAGATLSNRTDGWGKYNLTLYSLVKNTNQPTPPETSDTLNSDIPETIPTTKEGLQEAIATLQGKIDSANTATATADKILNGFTVYKNGELITGTYNESTEISSHQVSTITAQNTSYTFQKTGYVTGSISGTGSTSTLKQVLLNNNIAWADSESNTWNIYTYVPAGSTIKTGSAGTYNLTLYYLD